jgi:hypothetical protein
MFEEKSRSEIRHEALFPPGSVRRLRDAKKLSSPPVEIGLEKTAPNNVGEGVPVVCVDDGPTQPNN